MTETGTETDKGEVIEEEKTGAPREIRTALDHNAKTFRTDSAQDDDVEMVELYESPIGLMVKDLKLKKPREELE